MPQPPENRSQEELLNLVAPLVARVELLEAELARRDRVIEKQARRIAGLEKLLEAARRAGKRQAAPFSKGSARQAPKRPGRKRGKLYGRQARRPIPPKVDRHVLVDCPLFCPHCDGPVRVTGKADQYQTEIPPVKSVTTHFEIHYGECTRCGRTVQGRHRLQTSDARQVGTVQLGPKLIATAAHLNKVEGMSYQRIVGVLARLFGVTASRSGLARALQRLAARAGPSYEAIKTQLQGSPVVYPDETGWKVDGRTAWLHGATDGTATTVYTIQKGRGFAEAASLLGPDYGGTIASDGWAPYRKFEKATRQACLGHLLRRCVEMLETAKGPAARFPGKVKAVLKRAFELRDLRDAGSLTPLALEREKAALEHEMGCLLVGSFRALENRRLAKHLWNLLPDLFRFLQRPEMEGTNWPAETELRYAVINRKTCGGGNRTWTGARTQSVLMTLSRTARRRGLDGVELLADLLRSPAALVHPALLIQ